MNHRIGRAVFAGVVGLAVAAYAYLWITDPSGRSERRLQENVVVASRVLLEESVGLTGLQVVDPMSPDRKVGKVYVFREGDGWSVSGYYRRDADDSWHPYLMNLSSDLNLQGLSIKDAGLLELGAENPQLEISP